MDILIDSEDREAVIAALEDGYKAMAEESREAEELLAEVVAVLKAVSKGEGYPADKAGRLLQAVMERVWFLVVPPEKEESWMVERHLRLVKQEDDT